MYWCGTLHVLAALHSLPHSLHRAWHNCISWTINFVSIAHFDVIKLQITSFPTWTNANASARSLQCIQLVCLLRVILVCCCKAGRKHTNLCKKECVRACNGSVMRNVRVAMLNIIGYNTPRHSHTYLYGHPLYYVSSRSVFCPGYIRAPKIVTKAK